MKIHLFSHPSAAMLSSARYNEVMSQQRVMTARVVRGWPDDRFDIEFWRQFSRSEKLARAMHLSIEAYGIAKKLPDESRLPGHPARVIRRSS